MNAIILARSVSCILVIFLIGCPIMQAGAACKV